jgi:sulfur carrier protein
MQVTINGKAEDIAGPTVLDVLKAKNIDPQMVAVEVNDKMVEREHLGTTKLQDGDQIELLFYMGGGRA